MWLRRILHIYCNHKILNKPLRKWKGEENVENIYQKKNIKMDEACGSYGQG